MDGPLGALSAAAALAFAALPLLATPIVHAEDDPGPALAGTPVDGTTDPADAPVLTTGRYVDHLPASGEAAYLLPRTDDGSTFHVAAMFVGAGDSVGEGVRLKVGTTPGDQGCGSGGVFRPTRGEPAPVLFATVSTWTDVPDHDCAVAEELNLSVGVPTDKADVGREFQILVYEEPPLSTYSFGLLTPPEPPVWTTLDPAPRPREVSVGTTPTNAPVVRDGTYGVTLRPGHTVVLAVPLDWDQSLQAQLDARLPPDAPATGQIAIDVIGPLLGTSEVSFAAAQPPDWSDGTGPGRLLRIGAQSHVVSYTNRDSYDGTLNTESLAGIHYVLVRWTDTADAPRAARELRVPATVTLQVSGEAAHGIPSYTPIDGLIPPQAGSRLVDGTLQAPAAPEVEEPVLDETALPFGGTALTLAAVVLATIGLVVVRLRRRAAHRRATVHRHAGTAHPLGHHERGGRHRGS